jgi:acylaminoacyl-peptidase
MKLTAALLLALAAWAADPLTIDKALQVYDLSEPQFSPDGRRVALTVQEPPASKPAQRHIWVYDTVSHELRQWTWSSKSDHMPRWSPDGQTLAFLSDRDESNQIWLMSVNGGEA